ncbi:MAG: hypothetical protein AAGH79_08600 [Bacteroidota bacterium]
MRLFAFCTLILLCSCQHQDFNEATPYQYADLTGFWEQVAVNNSSIVEYHKKKLVTKEDLQQNQTSGIQLRANGKGYTDQLWHIGTFFGPEPLVYDLEWDWEVDSQQSLLLHLTLNPESESPFQMTYLIHELEQDRLLVERIH